MKTQGLLIALLCLAGGLGLGLALRPEPEEKIVTIEKIIEKEVPTPSVEQPDFSSPASVPPPLPRYSNLGSAPDWSKLAGYAQTLTREEFLHQLNTVYGVRGNWRPWLEVGDDSVTIKTTNDQSILIPFASLPGEKRTAPAYWRKRNSLTDLHITIDPGHIGGQFAKMEERFFKIGERLPAMEGTMTRIVAGKLAAKLRAAGATVSLTRTNDFPVTPVRPDDLTDFVETKYGQDQSPALAQRRRELFFYRTAEIRARAQLVNNVYRPDLVICLHFNADPWGTPDEPLLLNRQHLHILTNGAYTDNEWRQEDQRFELLQRLFQDTHSVELPLARSIIKSFQDHTDLPPYRYEENSNRANRLDSNDYIWARNLLASRVFSCPVIYMEPYVMNSRDTYQRIQQGDYEGLINGRPSLFEEYAQAVADGITRHYRSPPNN